MASCANHSEATAAARCQKCSSLVCDPCSAFLINGRVWCEPCGNEEIDSGKGHPIIALVVLVVMLCAWGAVVAYQLMVMNRFYVATLAGALVPFGAAWPIAYPPTTGDKPIIVNRTKQRVPLPASARVK